MGSNTIGSPGNTGLTATTSFAETKNTEATAVTDNLKINYGDAAKADRLMLSLAKVRQMQTQAQGLVSTRNPDFAGGD